MAKKGLLIGVIIGVIFLLALSITFYFIGFAGVWQILQTLFGIIIIGLFFAVIGWAVWYFLIKKHKYDATAVNKKKLVMAGRIQCPESLKNHELRLSGDKGHSYISFGKIIGFLQVQVLTTERAIGKDGKPEYEDIEVPDLATGQTVIQKKELYVNKSEPQDIFIVKPKKFLASLIDGPAVIRVHPKDHDDLVGTVTLKGFNLVPVSEYYYLNTDYLNAQQIDLAILNEAKRGITFEMMKDWKSTIDSAINIDPKHRKDIEQKHLIEVPQLQNVGIQGK